jgi:CheY-like chemotaxis protein
MTKSEHAILVVDDDDDLRDTLQGILEAEGYDVVAAANGRDALDYLRSNPLPCLVLLDLMMPVMDGWEFLLKKEADPYLASLPVVVITAAGEANVRALAPRPVLPKPLSFERLMGAVEQHC